MNTLAIMVRRTRGNQSLRQAGTASGIPFTSLNRYEKGHLPTLAHFVQLCRWMDLADDEIKTVLLSIDTEEPSDD